LLVAVSARFVPSLEVLICIVKIGRACRSVPFNTDPWSWVRDQFGDQNVRSTFAVATVARWSRTDAAGRARSRKVRCWY